MDKKQLLKELNFKAIRSSGAGGQHVNKVSSKIELSFYLASSEGLTEEEKAILHKKLANRLTKDGLLILTCQLSRSQHRNKNLVIDKLFELLSTNLIKEKPRKKTKPSKAAKRKRLDNKKRLSDKKENRKKFKF